MTDQFVKGTRFAKYAKRIKGIVNPQAKTLLNFQILRTSRDINKHSNLNI